MKSRDLIGDYHACDRCGYAWRDPDWPTGCPDCKAPAWWVASHWTADGARLHVPLMPAPVAA